MSAESETNNHVFGKFDGKAGVKKTDGLRYAVRQQEIALTEHRACIAFAIECLEAGKSNKAKANLEGLLQEVYGGYLEAFYDELVARHKARKKVR